MTRPDSVSSLISRVRQSVVLRLVTAGALVAACAIPIAVSSESPDVARAVPVINSNRIYFRQFQTSGSRWGTWSGQNCPSDARYHFEYGCVLANSVESRATLQYANVDGSGVTPVHIFCNQGQNPHWQAPVWDIAKVVVDPVGGKMYWEQGFEPGIASANLDGTGCELLGNGGYYGWKSLAISSSYSQLWTSQNATLRRFDIASKTLTTVTMTGLGFTPTEIHDLTVAGTTLYATIRSSSAGYVVKFPITDSSTSIAATVIASGLPVAVYGVSVDETNNKVYWADGSVVKRANLDGTSATTIYTGAVDLVTAVPSANKVFFSRFDGSAMTMALDGSGAAAFTGVAFDSVPFYVAGNALPTTTTSTSTSTTSSTTVPQSTTTVASAGGSGASVTTTTVKAGGTTTTTAVGSTTSTSSTTTTTIAAPDASDVDPGEGAVVIDGQVAASTLSRDKGSLVVSSGALSASILGRSSDGTQIDLDTDGNLVLDKGDLIEVAGSGFASESTTEVWMFSTPQKLGNVAVGAGGEFTERYKVPTDLETGLHKVVMKGLTASGESSVVTLGVKFGKSSGTSLATRLLIIVPVALAVLLGLLIPTTLRRRREEETVK